MHVCVQNIQWPLAQRLGPSAPASGSRSPAPSRLPAAHGGQSGGSMRARGSEGSKGRGPQNNLIKFKFN